MNIDEFKKLVADIRHAQREYFRTRSATAIDAAKRLERRVDEALADNGQKELFKESGK